MLSHFFDSIQNPPFDDVTNQFRDIFFLICASHLILKIFQLKEIVDFTL